MILKKRLLPGLLALVLAVLCALPVGADDNGFSPSQDDRQAETDYEGFLDPITGEPAGDPNRLNEDLILIPDGAYDQKTRRYLYAVGTAEVGMNLPNRAVTTQKVKLFVPDGLPVIVKRNGESVKLPDPVEFKDAGKYIVTFGSENKEELEFTIVGDVTGLIYDYTLPAGFVLRSLTVNAQERPVNTAVVDMSEEGKYQIEYVCVNTGVTHSLNVTVDHTPPTLKLNGVVDGYAKGPVDLSDIEKGASVSVYLNGDRIRYDSTLTKSGTYRIVLTDKAGNRATYQFVIRVYNNFSSIMFFIIMAGIAGALVAYIVLSRKRLRIR